MSDPISIALSGLTVQSTRVAAAASNIANADTVGNPTVKGDGYTPVDVVQISQGATGGTSATLTARDPAAVTVYDPANPKADDKGQVAYPNVDIATEIVTLQQASAAYKANLGVVKTANEMSDALLNTFDKRV